RTVRHAPAPEATSATSRRTVLVPRSMAATRMLKRTNAPPVVRRGVGRGTAWQALLLSLQRADIVHERPALIPRQVLPRRHGAAAVADLPEDLAVRFGRDARRRPVRRLRRRQRGGRGSVALAARPVAGRTVLLRELLRVGQQLGIVLLRRQGILDVL